MEIFGLFWDGPVIYQSQRHDAYEQALEQITKGGITFECSCSRKDLSASARHGPNGMIYPGTCRTGHARDAAQTSTRIVAEDIDVMVCDTVQGEYALNIANDIGDFVIRRADCLFSYHLATVVDDALDAYSEIVRGKDQLSLTPQHIYLQQKLNVATPRYAHLPLLTDSQGNKLAISSNAAPVDAMAPPDVWSIILASLGLQADDGLLLEQPSTILDWATGQWDLFAIDAKDKIVE